jgi:hypothetical protein
MRRNILLLLGFSLLSVISVPGQKKKLALCAEAETKIVETFPGAEAGYRGNYERDCRFSVRYGSDRALIAIEVFDSQQESKAEFSEHFDRLALSDYDPPYGEQHISLYGRWSEARGHKTDDSDHFIMLRYNKIRLTIIGRNYDLLLRIEPLLGSLNLEKYDADTGIQ